MECDVIRCDLRCSNRSFLPSGRLGWWLRRFPEKIVALGSHRVFWSWFHKYIVWIDSEKHHATTVAYKSFILWIYHRSDFHAIVLLSDGMEKTLSTPVSNTGYKCIGRHHSDLTWMALIVKLGLIAMSGVRAHNEELTRLGLTLPPSVRIVAASP